MQAPARALAVLSSVFACGCGGSESPTGSGREPVVSVSVTPTNTSLVQGATMTLSALVKDARGNEVTNRPISWSSSDETIASVTQAGVVTGVRAGASTTISATVDGKVGSVSLSVVVTALRVESTSSVITALDDTLRLNAVGTIAGGANVKISAAWSSSDPLVVRVDQTGLATSGSQGTATVTARVGEVSAVVQLSVQQQVTAVVISGAPQNGVVKAIGASLHLSATPKDRTGHAVLGATTTWSSNSPTVASIDASGTLTTRAIGKADITASSAQVISHLGVEVATRFHVAIDPFLATPAANARWEIPVVLVSYLPTTDGVTLDVSKCPDFYTLGPRSLSDVEADILNIYRRKKFAREQGSRFRAYSNSAATPSLGFRVIEHIIVYELPPGTSRQYIPPGNYLIDWPRVFADLGIEPLIRDRGAREIWFAYSSFDATFPSYNPAIHNLADSRLAWESNMSSPITGDVSNSDRNATDLPIYNRTYTVYGINFRRSQAEAVHNVGHQLEAMLSFINQRYDGNTNLFWKKFVGQNSAGEFITGRAGWTHMPPNTTVAYDYLNPTPVASDIEDWRPDGGGAKTQVSSATWAAHKYSWPGAADFTQRVETQWYIYWMQSLPGLDNAIPLGNGKMNNWWQFMGDWDGSVQAGIGLATVRDQAAPNLSPRNARK